jgi:hypothetical protein
MLSLTIVALSCLASAHAAVQLLWKTQNHNEINIVAPERAEAIRECLESELKARLRFEVRLCRRRSGWVDHCEDSRSQLHTATYDQVTETYRVTTDRFDDESEPTAVGVPSRDEAIRLVTTLEGFPIRFLVREESDILDHSRAYLQARTIFNCRGNSSRPFTHLSRILTLGLHNNVEDRDEWENFNLK